MICSLFIFTVLMVTGCQGGEPNNTIGLEVPTAFPSGPAVVIGDALFEVELANTPALRTQGLSDRPSLPEQTGMLFIFETGRASNFWMNRMQFPLDFVWIGEDCTVVDVTENVPNPDPDSPTNALPTYGSSDPAAYNFEINAGEVEKLGIQKGDSVSFPGIHVPGASC